NRQGARPHRFAWPAQHCGRADRIGDRRARRAPLRLLAKAEVATRSALHNGLTAVESKLAIEALDHRKITLAVDMVADIGKAELLVELGIAATGDVEVQAVAGFVENLDVKRAAAGPHLVGDLSKGFGAVSPRCSPRCTVLDGKPRDRRIEDLQHGFLAVPFLQG